MPLMREEWTAALRRMIRNCIFHIINLEYRSSFNADEALQVKIKMQPILKELCENKDKYSYFFNRQSGGAERQERVFYDLWSLIYKPEILAMDFGWIKKVSNLEQLDANSKAILVEMKQIVLSEYLEIFEKLMASRIGSVDASKPNSANNDIPLMKA